MTTTTTITTITTTITAADISVANSVLPDKPKVFFDSAVVSPVLVAVVSDFVVVVFLVVDVVEVIAGMPVVSLIPIVVVVSATGIGASVLCETVVGSTATGGTKTTAADTMFDTALTLSTLWWTFRPKNKVLFSYPAGNRITNVSLSDGAVGEPRLPAMTSMLSTCDACWNELRKSRMFLLKRSSYEEAAQEIIEWSQRITLRINTWHIYSWVQWL